MAHTMEPSTAHLMDLTLLELEGTRSWFYVFLPLNIVLGLTAIIGRMSRV